ITVHQLIPLRHLVALIMSRVEQVGGKEERTFAGVDVRDPSFYGGNVTLYALRMLVPLIHRANSSAKGEVDVWEFDPGFPTLKWEPWIRHQVERLRREDISARHLKSLIEGRKAEIAAAEKEAADRLLTKEQRANAEDQALRAAEEAKRAKLRGMIASL